MKAIKFSQNAKLNKVLNDIYDSLLSIHDTKSESIAEIKHYKDNFPEELDYNLYQYGNLLIWDIDIEELYRDYKSLQKSSIESIRNIYKRQVRYVANYILTNEK